MKRLLISAILVGVASIVLSFALIHSVPPATHAAASSTSICGLVSASSSWTVGNSPYVICSSGATIGPTATLTIQPGVTVLFSSTAVLNIQGTMNAVGSAVQPITFTGAVATPGYWAAIYANNTLTTPASINMSYVTIDGGGALYYKALLYADYGVVTMTHSIIRNGSFDGIHLTNNEAGFNIQTTSFISNSRYPVELDTPTTDIQLSDLSASGNGTNGVYLYAQGMHVAGQRRWSNPGIPYFVDYAPYNKPGDDLTIDPGSDLRFNPTFGLSIGGQLKAIGLPDQPITFTAQNHTAGGWYGLTVDGGPNNAIAQLDYATVEYGAGGSSGANIIVNHGQIIAHHSNVRYSAKDGVQFNVAASGSILNSQIVSNSVTSYGIRNTVALSTSAILATNDWWGDPNGPATDNLNCSSGHGDKVTNGVLYRPVLTSTNLSVEFPLSAAPQLTLTPRRWFAPADGVSKVYFDMTLRDGNGTPLAGRTTRLHVTGPVVTIYDGGLTDLNGHALGYIIANDGDTGDANVSATLDGLASCEGVVPPTAKVTFTPKVSVTDLFPNSPAPYFDGNISITPQPIMTGITETIHVKLTNPLSVPITTTVEFGYAQSSIGLAFGPIKDITPTIPASSTIDLSADFMPIVSGHYCVQVTYAIIGPTMLHRPQAGPQLKQFNFNPEQGPMIPPDGKETLDKADKSWNKVKQFSPRGTNIQIGILDRWWGWAKDTSKKISQALGFDPPRPDYNVSTLPVWHRWPHSSAGSFSQAHADALNAASDALADVNAYGDAAAVAMDRYGGAVQANDLSWAAQQANAQEHYQQEFGQALLTYADKLDSLIAILQTENPSGITITVGDVISYQQSLSTTGFITQEQDDAKLVGLTDADIETMRQEIISTDPNDIAGNVLDIYTNEADISRQLGNALLQPVTFAPGFSVSGSAGLLQATAATTTTGNTLAQINNAVSTFQLGNPFNVTTSITLTARRIDLPADWAVEVSPSIISLAQGQQVTVTVTILTGSPAPQGSVPRVAVEGYANNQLLGGVVVDVVVPNYMPYFLHTYLPLIKK